MSKTLPTFDEILTEYNNTQNKDIPTFDEILLLAKDSEITSEYSILPTQREIIKVPEKGSFIKEIGNRIEKATRLLAPQLAQSAVTVTEMVHSTTPLGILSKVGEISGAEKPKLESSIQQLSKDLNTLSKRIEAEYKPEIGYEYLSGAFNQDGNWKKPTWWIAQFADQVPQIMMQTGIAYATGGSSLAGTIGIGALEAGSSKNDLLDIQSDLKKKGVKLSTDKINALAVSVGVINGLLERVSGVQDILTKKFGKSVVNETVQKTSVRQLINKISQMPNKDKIIKSLVYIGKKTLTGSMEGGTEALQELVSLTANDYAENPKDSILQSAIEVFQDKNKVTQIVGAGLVGFGIGGVTDITADTTTLLGRLESDKIQKLSELDDKVEEIKELPLIEDVKTEVEKVNNEIRKMANDGVITQDEAIEIESLVNDQFDDVLEQDEELYSEEIIEPESSDMEADLEEQPQIPEIDEQEAVIEEELPAEMVEDKGKGRVIDKTLEPAPKKAPKEPEAKQTKADEDVISDLVGLSQSFNDAVFNNKKDEANNRLSELEKYYDDNKDSLSDEMIATLESVINTAKTDIKELAKKEAKAEKIQSPKPSKAKVTVTEDTKPKLKTRTFTNNKGETLTGAILKETDRTYIVEVDGKPKRLSKKTWSTSEAKVKVAKEDRIEKEKGTEKKEEYNIINFEERIKHKKGYELFFIPQFEKNKKIGYKKVSGKPYSAYDTEFFIYKGDKGQAILAHKRSGKLVVIGKNESDMKAKFEELYQKHGQEEVDRILNQQEDITTIYDYYNNITDETKGKRRKEKAEEWAKENEYVSLLIDEKLYTHEHLPTAFKGDGSQQALDYFEMKTGLRLDPDNKLKGQLILLSKDKKPETIKIPKEDGKLKEHWGYSFTDEHIGEKWFASFNAKKRIILYIPFRNRATFGRIYR